MMTRQFTPAAHPCVSAIPAFDDNYIWLLRKPGSPCVAVVDPGDADAVNAVLQRDGLTLTSILLTHHHRDHVGGVAALRARHAPKVFGPRHETIDGIDQRCIEGDEVLLPELELALRVIDVPGHTGGHISYFAQTFGADPRPLLFCGDTLFAGGCGRIFEGTPPQMLASLDKLAALPPETLVFCAHEYTLSNLKFAAAVEPSCDDVLARLAEVACQREIGEATVPSAIGIELRTNPFLRSGDGAVIASAAQRLGRAPTSSVETFAAIREWKNVFR